MTTDALEAYAFVPQTSGSPDEFVATVTETVTGARFACRTVGTAVAFVAAEVPSLEVLQQQVVPGVLEAGATSASWTTANTGRAPRFGHPVKRARATTGALVRIRARNPRRHMRELSERFASLTDATATERGFTAGAIQTTGAEYNVLLDLGAPDYDALAQSVDLLEGLTGATVLDVALLQLP
jgi:hypothetical protein